MPAGKKDGHSAADNASVDYPRTVFPQRRPPDLHHSPDPLSEPFPGQNLARPPRAYSRERTSEFATRSACCSSSPIQKPVSNNRAAPGVPAGAALPSTSDGYKAAGPGEIEPGLRSLAEY